MQMTLSRSIRHAAGALALAAGLFAGTAGAYAEDYRMVSAYPDSNFHTQNLRAFIDDVKTSTDGKIDISLFSNSSVLKAPEILHGVGDGLVGFGEIFLAAYANEDPLFGADAVAYLISGYDQAAKFDAATRELLAKRLEDRGLKLLFTVPWPPAGFYSTRPLNSAADLDKLRMRSSTPITKEWTDKFNMQTVVVQVPELAQAFATGALDAMFTASALAPAVKAWEFTEYFYDLGAVLTRNAVVMNLEAYNALDPELQQKLLAASKKAEEAGWAASRKADDANKTLMAENGMKIAKPTPELEGALKQAANEVIETWLASLPEDARTAVNAGR